LALDGVFEAAEEIKSAEMSMRGRGETDPAFPDFAAHRDLYILDRKGSFDFAVELSAEIEPSLEELRRISKYSFEAHESVVRTDLNFTRAGSEGA
jgi:hypothetical protein